MERNPNKTSERESSQLPALELLKKFKYKFISPKEAEELRGQRLDRVLLKPILEKQLKKINKFEYKSKKYSFSDKNIKQAILDIDEPLIDGLVKTNEKIYDHLILGKSYEERLDDGARKSFSLRYIDWDNIDNNDFHVTEEFAITKLDDNYRKPDIVLFVNGIPFAVIECKKAAVDLKEGISQNIRNQFTNEIPNLFKFTQILMSLNKNGAKYATTGTAEKFWSVWKTDKEPVEIEKMEKELKKHIKGRMITEQDKAIYSLFKPERLLELTKFFIVYDKNVKKIARYQQYFSIKHTLDKIKTFNEDGSRQGGLIWHTQGSGKSLTMVMLAKSLMKDDDIKNPKVVIVTDRVNLDKQIKNTFIHTGMSPIRANTGQHLAKILKDNKANIITTVINKFESVLNNNQINEDINIFVLVDESHRSQFDEMHTRMRRVFPNACYLGFTGTPIMKKDKNSMNKFGGEIHRYTIDQAVKDGAILPLLYEGKMIEQEVNQSAIDRRLEMITKRLNDKQKEEIKKKWSRFEKVASSFQRLELIAMDINENYINEWKETPFKAMLACSKKSEAIRYKEIFDEIGDLKTAVIISPPDEREGYEEVDKASKDIQKEFWEKMMDIYGNQTEYEDSIKDDFVNGDKIDILIVVSKLLTGFDAPKATVLYIDKPLKEHSLLQAIARVNRLYEGKEFGFIIDYRGLLGNLDKALTDYSETGLDNFEKDDIYGALNNISSIIISDLKQAYSELISMFSGIKNQNDTEEYEVFLADEVLRNEFYEILSRFSKNLSITVSSEKIYDELGEEKIKQYKKELKFFQEIRKNVKLRYSDPVDHKEYEAKLQKLLDNYINAEEVIRITNPVDIFDKEKFDEELVRVEGERAKADTIRTRMSKKINEKEEENPSYYNKFSMKIRAVLDEYVRNRISEAEYLNKMQDIRKEFYKGETVVDCPDIIRSNNHAKAFYGEILKTLNKNMVGEEEVPFNSRFTRKENQVAELSLKVYDVIENRKKVDWKNNPEIHKLIEQDIDDLLFDFSEESGIRMSFENIDEIIADIKTVALKRY